MPTPANGARSSISGDAYVFVTPEYDYFTPPSLTNAMIYLWQEWNYKPAGFVSYGGVSGGLRSVEISQGTDGRIAHGSHPGRRSGVFVSAVHQR
ncbi:NADPH-dependent FMN reductase [Phyllobacterium sp. A18/5-2]|uniref:NADPH-dependent FMN reductase n=1 Tax=Phyllobacterium sp. A18/5-2 TaxID=2978392 RepID=UPI0029057BEE|nr:NAD(P)H-dependent oxidoreductase [Phyllobacterium sp. A18/5-2]